MEPLTRSDAWKALSTHYEAIERLHLRELFARDPGRGERLTIEGVGLFLDHSKTRITDRTIELLIELAEESGLRSCVDAMGRGDKISGEWNVKSAGRAHHSGARVRRGTDSQSRQFDEP